MSVHQSGYPAATLPIASSPLSVVSYNRDSTDNENGVVAQFRPSTSSSSSSHVSDSDNTSVAGNSIYDMEDSSERMYCDIGFAYAPRAPGSPLLTLQGEDDDELDLVIRVKSHAEAEAIHRKLKAERESLSLNANLRNSNAGRSMGMQLSLSLLNEGDHAMEMNADGTYRKRATENNTASQRAYQDAINQDPSGAPGFTKRVKKEQKDLRSGEQKRQDALE